MSKEFRNIHSARNLLKLYVKNGRDINLIKNLPISNIDRFDVWQIVFAEEPEAYRELMIKEYYHTFRKEYQDEACKDTMFLIAVNKLTQLEEWDTPPLTVEDAIKIIIDCLGKESLPKLIAKAEYCTKLRREIIEPYFKKDNEWVGYAKKVVNKLKKYDNSLTFSKTVVL